MPFYEQINCADDWKSHHCKHTYFLHIICFPFLLLLCFTFCWITDLFVRSWCWTGVLEWCLFQPSHVFALNKKKTIFYLAKNSKSCGLSLHLTTTKIWSPGVNGIDTDSTLITGQLQIPSSPRSQQSKWKTCKLRAVKTRNRGKVSCTERAMFTTEPYWVCCGYSHNQLLVFTASPWSEESLSAGELSPSSIASCLWPRSTRALGWLRREEPCVRVVHPFLRPRCTSPVQLSWGPLSTLAARKVWITDHSSNVG